MRYENGVVYVTRGSERDIRILNDFVKGKLSLQQMENKIKALKNEMDIRFDSDYSKPAELYDAICIISKDTSVKKVVREIIDNPVHGDIPTEFCFGNVKCTYQFEQLSVVVPMTGDDIKYFFEELRNVNRGYLTADSAIQALKTYCDVTDEDEDVFLQDKCNIVKTIEFIVNTIKQDRFTIYAQDYTSFDVHVWATVDAI